MKSLTATVILLVTFLATPLPVWADYAAGAAALKRGDVKGVFEAWEPLAEAGDAEAQYGLGLLLFLADDFRRSIDWYRKAALQSHAKALYSLGHINLNGVGVDKSPSKALCLFRASATSGYAEAQRQFALELGKVPVGSSDDAMRHTIAYYYWLKRAAAQGDPEGQYALAVFLFEQKIVEDKDEAYVYLILSAGKKFERAVDLLGKRQKAARGFPKIREVLAEAEKREANWKPVKEQPRAVPLRRFRGCLP